jgi:hypothetical protein
VEQLLAYRIACSCRNEGAPPDVCELQEEFDSQQRELDKQQQVSLVKYEARMAQITRQNDLGEIKAFDALLQHTRQRDIGEEPADLQTVRRSRCDLSWPDPPDQEEAAGN